MTQLRWALCDSEGRLLAPIEQFHEDQVTISLNDVRNGSVTVSIEDPVVRLVEAGNTRLKAWLNGHIVLNAPVFLPHHQGDDGDGTLTISATDNLRLATASVRGFAEQVGIDQSEIMARLVEAADATPAEKAADVLGHGIIRGSLPVSLPRDRTYYDLTNVWGSIVELSQVIDGPDFELEPLDREDGVFAQLNTYPQHQGTDRSDMVAFEYGVGATNVDAFTWGPSTEQLCNRFICAGETPEGSPTTPAWMSENIDSQRMFGVYEGNEVDTEVSAVPTLKERADNVVATRSLPINFFTLLPSISEAGRDEVEYGVPPRAGPPTDFEADYWIGDTIRVIARIGEVATDLKGRVVTVGLATADAAGNVVTAIACTPLEAAAGVSGREVNLTVGPPNKAVGSEPTVPTEEPVSEEPEEAIAAPGKRGSGPGILIVEGHLQRGIEGAKSLGRPRPRIGQAKSLGSGGPKIIVVPTHRRKGKR